MFGRSIWDRQFDTGQLRQRFDTKRRAIARLDCSLYVETIHAFLKSFADLAAEAFPKAKYFHLVRDPLATARSLANRHLAADRIWFPARCYRAPDGHQLFRWSLSGLEPIFAGFETAKLSLFQRYLLEWIGIENRVMAFLDEHVTLNDCATLHTPGAFSERETMLAALRQLEMPVSGNSLKPAKGAGGPVRQLLFGSQNRTPRQQTRLGATEHREALWVIDRLSPTYLKIFEHPPYVDQPWAAILHPKG